MGGQIIPPCLFCVENHVMKYTGAHEDDPHRPCLFKVEELLMATIRKKEEGRRKFTLRSALAAAPGRTSGLGKPKGGFGCCGSRPS
jgi:hypothetical protein